MILTIFLTLFNPLATGIGAMQAAHAKINNTHDCSILISTLRYNLTIHFTGESLFMSTYS